MAAGVVDHQERARWRLLPQRHGDGVQAGPPGGGALRDGLLLRLFLAGEPQPRHPSGARSARVVQLVSGWPFGTYLPAYSTHAMNARDARARGGGGGGWMASWVIDAAPLARGITGDGGFGAAAADCGARGTHHVCDALLGCQPLQRLQSGQGHPRVGRLQLAVRAQLQACPLQTQRGTSSVLLLHIPCIPRFRCTAVLHACSRPLEEPVAP